MSLQWEASAFQAIRDKRSIRGVLQRLDVGRCHSEDLQSLYEDCVSEYLGGLRVKEVSR